MPHTNVQDIIFRKLTMIQPLLDKIATSDIDPTAPAIFDRWTPDQNAMPYINVSFATLGESSYRNRSSVEIDIFSSRDQVGANEIFQIIKKAMNKSMYSVDGLKYRMFYERDEEIPEPEDEVTHWNGEFTVIWWDSD